MAEGLPSFRRKGRRRNGVGISPSRPSSRSRIATAVAAPSSARQRAPSSRARRLVRSGRGDGPVHASLSSEREPRPLSGIAPPNRSCSWVARPPSGRCREDRLRPRTGRHRVHFPAPSLRPSCRRRKGSASASAAELALQDGDGRRSSVLGAQTSAELARPTPHRLVRSGRGNRRARRHAVNLRCANGLGSAPSACTWWAHKAGRAAAMRDLGRRAIRIDRHFPGRHWPIRLLKSGPGKK